MRTLYVENNPPAHTRHSCRSNQGYLGRIRRRESGFNCEKIGLNPRTNASYSRTSRNRVRLAVSVVIDGCQVTRDGDPSQIYPPQILIRPNRLATGEFFPCGRLPPTVLFVPAPLLIITFGSVRCAFSVEKVKRRQFKKKKKNAIITR